MNKKADKKIALNQEEKSYISGVLEAHRSRLMFFDEEQSDKSFVERDIRIINSLNKKLGMN